MPRPCVPYNPLSFLALFIVLFFIPACPEPSTHHDGFVESSTEGGVEKTESTAEITSEESANPEDGAPIEREPIREEGPEPDIKETDKPYIERVNGNGSQLPVNAAASPSKIDNLPIAPTKPSPSRIKDALVIEGNLLDQIDRWVLQSKDLKNTEQTWANTQIQKDSNMKHTLSLLGRNLVAGSFLLLGFSANTQVVSADIFILQGEKGDAGAKGDIGDNKFTDNDATLLKALLTKLQANGDNLDITANTVTFKSATAQKVTLDLGNNATIKSGNATFDFAGDTITAKATTFSIDTTTKLSLKSPDVSVDSTTFEVKGTANKVALKLDDTNKKITFDSTNVHVQSGLGATAPPGPMPNDPPRTNSLGNLIIGYNENPSDGPFAGYRVGSHNLVVGSGHSYLSAGGFIAGQNNTASGAHSSVSGGQNNTASGAYSSVSGGQNNTASGAYSSVSGGQNNKAGQDPVGQPSIAATHTFVCGGNGNFANTNYKITCP